MFNPTYLQCSRHGIFYFRWSVRQHGPYSRHWSIRISLGTREPSRALQLAMQLSYLARRVTDWGLRVQMDHRQLRSVLMEHFRKWLGELKSRVDTAGPLPADEIALLRASADLASMELQSGPVSPERHDRWTQQFIDKYQIELNNSSPLYGALKRNIVLAYRSALNEALNYSDNAEQFDFSLDDEQTAPLMSYPAPKKSLPLKEVVRQYWEHVKIENRWSKNSEGEYADHIELLYEKFGADMDLSSFGTHQAREMRSVLQKYPVNRRKMKETRGRSLDEVLADTSVRKLHGRTINKYLTTYSGMFAWAAREKLCDANPFEGLLLRTSKINGQAPKIAFTDDQLKIILDAILSPSSSFTQHHKWGVLLGAYTGARLNEISQLYIDDIYLRDDIWCFDINKNPGTKKRLKNASSKRVIPVHTKLIECGFVEYFQSKKRDGFERLFPEFSYTQSDGYGRNLGRWTNETLLPKLELKQKDLSFHSFRHTVIRKLISADVSQAHIMAIVGHEPGTTTLSTYNRSGFPPQQLLAALERAFAK